MSFHTTTMMIRWAVTADENTAKILDELHLVPMKERKKDPRVEKYVKDMYESWCHGTKIERLATLGWMEYESILMFCDILEHLPKLREEYLGQVLLHGIPPELKDEDIKKYETESQKQRKAAENGDK